MNIRFEAAPALVVPIDIAALCVGDPDAHGGDGYGTKDFAELAADFSILPYLNASGAPVQPKANVSEMALPRPFQPAANPLGQGVHLHWALPASLTRGATGAGGKIQFPTAPNRWLVVRIATDESNPSAPACAVSGWVIESDHLWDEGDGSPAQPHDSMSRAVPLAPETKARPNKAQRRLGRAFPVATWIDGTAKATAAVHTALGYGTPSFAAVYQHCTNVFGFFDALADASLPAGSKLSYAVIGWYSGAGDPLATLSFPDGVTTPAAKLAFLERTLAWTFALDSASAFPARTVCSGLLRGITWDPQRRYVTPRADTPVDVAIGNHTTEAIAALVAEQPQFAALPEIERVLLLLQLNLLSRLDVPGGLAAAEELLHQAAFGARSGGTIWRLKRAGAGAPRDKHAPVLVDAAALTDAAAASGDSGTVPADLATKLNDLNITQEACDRAAREITSRRSQIFLDWYRYMLLQHPETGAPGGDDAFHLIKSELDELNAALQSAQQLATTLTQRVDAVTAALGGAYQLDSTDAPRYWQPNDPVLVISGADLNPSARHGGNGLLACRLSSALLSSMTAAGAGPVTAAALPRCAADARAAIPPEAAALVGEAFFLDPDRAWILARAVAAQGGPTNPATGDPAGFLAAVRAAQAGLMSGVATGGVSFTGRAPSPVGVKAWSAPWIPLVLQWEVAFSPTRPVGEGLSASYPSDFIASNFALDADAIDLTPKAAPPATIETYSGSIVLSHRTEVGLTSQIDTWLRQHPDDPHASELKQVRDGLTLSAMAQAMDGFNQSLLTRKATLQLPVSDPLASLDGLDHDRLSNQLVPQAVAGENATAPLPLRLYNPLRAGTMKITRLRIVDAFGQVRDFNAPPLLRAASLRPAGEAASGATVVLPPRITQPSRLLFRWLSATGDQVESSGPPAATPICGWVLFNHLDDSLMLYDADGHAVGSLNVQGPTWQGAPGSDRFGQPIEQALADQNPHLKAFALGIYNNPRARQFLTRLLEVMDRSMTSVNPIGQQQDGGLSLLVGQPLALARASLRLELEGLPALNQGTTAFNAAASARAPYAKRDAAGFPSVKFPVRLGDLSNLNDGLIGYFIDDGSAGAYQTFYAPASASADGGISPPAADTLSLASGGDAAALTLSMLVDPRGSIHATTGILPVKEITIPPDLYSDALGRIAVTFLASPIVTGEGPLALPLPAESGYAWSWVTARPGGRGFSVNSDLSPIRAAGTLDSARQLQEGWLRLTRAAAARTARPAGLLTAAPPLTLSVQNADGKPAVYITTEATRNRITISLTNQTGAPLALKGGAAPVPEEQVARGGPTALYLTFGALFSASELGEFQVSAPGWNAAFFRDDVANWGLTPTDDLVLADEASIAIVLTNVIASGQPAPGTVTVDYYNAGAIDDDSCAAALLRENPPSGQRDLSLNVGFVDDSTVFLTRDANNPITNTLVFHLSNPSPTTPIVSPGTPPGPSPPVFLLFFVCEEAPGYGALTTRARAADVQVKLAQVYADRWSVEPGPPGDTPTWRLLPLTPEILGVGSAASAEFTIENLVSELSPGITQLYIQYSNIPGYNDGAFVLSVEKRLPTPGILRFINTTPDIINQGDPVTLAWQTFGVSRLDLSYEIDGTTYRHSAPGDLSFSQMYSPLPLPVESITYYLDAYDGSGHKVAGAYVPITVRLPPVVIHAFQVDVNPVDLQHGPQTVTLSWDVANAVSIEIEGIGKVVGTSLRVQVSATQMFVLRAFGRGAADLQTRALTVQSIPDFLAATTFTLRNFSHSVISSIDGTWTVDQTLVETLSFSKDGTGQYAYSIDGGARSDHGRYDPIHESWSDPRTTWMLDGTTLSVATGKGPIALTVSGATLVYRQSLDIFTRHENTFTPVPRLSDEGFSSQIARHRR
ncbi:hypothetical protein [Sorangium sp. So ce381]|uniref:hypothetical protein n=1 Tax=Sorangium sp. So ce381 TaxID=3133307 RepID=UPI003F5BA5D4